MGNLRLLLNFFLQFSVLSLPLREALILAPSFNRKKQLNVRSPEEESTSHADYW
ncbi:hypothetical protein SLEP1_g22690 [Rubroshorea leprosula]|uniref:Uncharacterized protein n=1 Tax=Rubroshorea leprosula TaxID=152421 RepID=A0AAV5JJ58_9ROSI|nr:hypothetical protein SLEP1_g22690 [Rubroshorea leprosula]